MKGKFASANSVQAGRPISIFLKLITPKPQNPKILIGKFEIDMLNKLKLILMCLN